MHITVKPKDKPDFEVSQGEYPRLQENILTFLYHQTEASENELLPTCFHQEEKLESAVSSLVDKQEIVEDSQGENTVYRILES